MNDQSKSNERDKYSQTLFLPQTDFPMRAGLPQREPEILARWKKQNLSERLRQTAKGRTKFVLHDGPPYANGNIHIGHALNKILKDVVTRSQQMLGYDSNYVPGWDCHGLPIEWKIEEQYRQKGQDKDAVDVVEFRQECRRFAEHWVGVQRDEFRRLGVTGKWDDPYLTMDYHAEAVIAGELGELCRDFGKQGLSRLRTFNHPRQRGDHRGMGIAHRQGEYLPGFGHRVKEMLVHRIAVLVRVISKMLAQFPHVSSS